MKPKEAKELINKKIQCRELPWEECEKYVKCKKCPYRITDDEFLEALKIVVTPPKSKGKNNEENK